MSTAISTTADATTAWRTPVELTLLGAIWGASFMFQRVAAPQFGAVAAGGTAAGTGCAAAAALPVAGTRALPGQWCWWRIVGIGAINSAIPFVLFAWATERAPAGIGAISNATTAIFAPLLALLLFGEKIRTRRAIGIAAGFVGVVVLASGKTAGASVLGAALAGTFAGLLYAVGAVLARRYLAGLPAGGAGSRHAGLRRHPGDTVRHRACGRDLRPPCARGGARWLRACCAPALPTRSSTGCCSVSARRVPPRSRT